MECKIFIRRNFGCGYDEAWPELSFFQKHIYWRLIRNVGDGMRRWFGFWIYKYNVPDSACPDPGAASRRPVVDITIVFPLRIKGNPMLFEEWVEFARKCQDVALGVHAPGIHNVLSICVPQTWKGGSEW